MENECLLIVPIFLFSQFLPPKIEYADLSG